MSYSAGYPVNFTAGGDTTSQAIAKFISEFTKIYGNLNTEAGEIDDVQAAIAAFTYISSLVEDTTPQLGGNLDVNGKTLTSASNGDVAISPDGTGKIDLAKKALFQKQVYFAEVDDTAAGANITIDWTAGLKHKFTLSENVTFTFTAPTGPTNLVLRVVQASSAKSITWPSTVKWVYTPTYTTTSKTYLFNFYFNGTNYLGSMVGPYTE